MEPLKASVEFLQSQLEPIEREEMELKERLKLLTQAKAPLRAALKALSFEKQTTTKANSKPSKPCARKQDVQAVCMALVEANPAIQRDELEDLVKHKLSVELGFNLSGFKLRFGECLASEAFTVAQDGAVTLSTDAEAGRRTSGSNDSRMTRESPVERFPDSPNRD